MTGRINASGASLQLKTLSYSASLSEGSWCVSSNFWAFGRDRGTPGAASECN